MGIREFLSGISKFFEGPLIRLTITSWTARKRGSTLGLEREVELLDLLYQGYSLWLAGVVLMEHMDRYVRLSAILLSVIPKPRWTIASR